MIKIIKNKWQLVFLFLISLIPVLWFLGRGDVLITGLDTNFPLNPLLWFLRRLYVWNGVNNAGVDFSSSTAGLFFHFVQVVPFMFGLSLKYVELFSMVFWFFAIVSSSYILSRIIVPKSRLAQVVFVTIYSINTYLFNTWENIKVSNLSLVAALPLFVAIVFYWSNKKITSLKATVFLCGTSILASGAGINPAYLSVIILALITEISILIFYSKQKDEKINILKIGFLSILIIIIVNSFWILPLINLLFNNKAIGDLGFTDWLVSLSQNTSIVNIIRLQGAWDWYALDSAGMPQYLPYTLNYLYKFPFIIFSFALPFLSFLSYVFANKSKRYWYVFLGILALLGIFFGVGAHTPTGSLYLFFSKYVPFFSFFRSPWYIFTPLLIIAYSGLTGLLYEQLLEIINHKFALILNFFGCLFIVSYLVYNYPLIEGKIFRPDTNGFYVKFPSYVFDAKDWLNKSSNIGRIISYPDDQLESFEWGYKGTESILSLFSDAEVITPSFNVASKTFSALQNLFYSQIKKGQYTSAISLLNFLNADQIFYKKDVSTLSPPIGREIQAVTEARDIGEWSFLKIKGSIDPKIFITNKIYKNLSNPEDFIYLSSLFDPRTIVVNHDDAEVAKIPYSENLPIILKADNLLGQEGGTNNTQEYRVTIPKDDKFIFAIEKEYVEMQDIKIQLDSRQIDRGLISQNDSLIKVGPLRLTEGPHLLRVDFPEAFNILGISDFSSYSKDLGLRSEALPSDVKQTLVAFNSADVQKVISLPVRNFNPFVKYAISFDYKYVYGSVPIMDIVQSNSTSPIKTGPIYLGSSMDWSKDYKIFEPVGTPSKIEILIKMPPQNPGDKSKAYLENISVKRIYDNKIFVMEVSEKDNLGTPTLSFKKISPVKYEVDLKASGNVLNGTIISFLDSYSPGWSLKVVGKNNNNVTPIHFSIDGYANAWYLSNIKDSKLIIYYKPQKLFLIGVVISASMIVGILLYGLMERKG